MTTAQQINDTYSLAGADASKAEAGTVGTITPLSAFDQAEMTKLYTPAELALMEQRAQQQAEAAAARRVQSIEVRERQRSEMIGGLAIRGLVDVDSDTDLADLPDAVKRSLPWHLPITGQGPSAYGVTFVRKSWDAEDALRLSKVANWNVRKATARWTTKDGHKGRSARNKFLIVRDPVPEYAADCRCDGFHDRPGEKRTSKAQELCPWLVEWDLGLCRADWKAEIQTEDLVDVLATFTADGRVIPETVGWLAGGEKVFIQMRLADTRYVLGSDPWSVYLGIHNNFTGQGAAKIHLSGVRDLCDNTHTWSERLATSIGKVAHYGDVKAKLAETGKMILAAEGHMDEEAKRAEELAAIELTMADLKTITETLVEDSPRASFRRADLLGHMLSDETLDPELRRSGYGVRESVNRYYAQLGDKRTATSRLTAVWAPDGIARTATRKTEKLVQTIGRTRRVGK